MRKLSWWLALACGAAGGLGACAVAHKAPPTPAYRPADPALYTTIARLDSAFFRAYNTCDVNLASYGDFYADSIEFYHDQGGLDTSKPHIIEATKRNICGKVTRELVPGSLEVYPIHHYGAVEFGWHRFHNNTQPAGTPSPASRFVIIWRQQPQGWKIARVISLH